MAHSRGSGFRTNLARSQRRKTSWQIGPQSGVDGASVQISASQATLLNGVLFVSEDGLTLVRTRGEFVAHLQLAAADGDGFHGAFGIAVATSAAVTAGVASVPTPLTEENWDGWLYHRYFGLFSGGPIAAATATQQKEQVNATSAALRFEVDSKAMRKLEVDMAIYAAIEVVELGAASQMRFAFNSRTLIKLP